MVVYDAEKIAGQIIASLTRADVLAAGQEDLGAIPFGGTG